MRITSLLAAIVATAVTVSQAKPAYRAHVEPRSAASASDAITRDAIKARQADSLKVKVRARLIAQRNAGRHGKRLAESCPA